VEIHTGRYCDARAKDQAKELARVVESVKAAAKLGLRVAAGHGLNYDNIAPLIGLDEIEEYNIGHSIVARAIFVGFGEAVREMLALLEV
jgi:pyridoxine 5-phosphate synthase